MGVAIYIQGYEKNPAAITGEIKILGWYEVNNNEIDKYKLPDSFTVVHEDFKSFELAKSSYWNFGLEDPAELSFHYHFMNNLSGGGYRNEDGQSFGIMFDGVRLYDLVTKILDGLSGLELNEQDMANEEKNLQSLQQVLKVVAEHKGIVGFVWG